MKLSLKNGQSLFLAVPLIERGAGIILISEANIRFLIRKSQKSYLPKSAMWFDFTALAWLGISV
jgi:hypothetical protein